MKYLSVLVVLFAVVATGAYAEEPLNPKFRVVNKKIVPKNKITPAAVTKIKKPVIQLVNPKDNASDDEKDNEANAAGAYALELGEIQITENPATCSRTWLLDVTNTGTAASSGNISTASSVIYERNTGQINETGPKIIQIPALAPGQTQQVTGWVDSIVTNVKSLIVRLKDGDEIVDTKTVTLPEEGEYSFSLGDSIFTDSTFTVSIANEGAKSIPHLLVSFRGLTDASTGAGFRIVEKTLPCITAGGTASISIAVPAQDHIGYRVMIYRAGQNHAIRNYIK